MNYDLFKDRADIWRAGQAAVPKPCIESGFSGLDAVLPGGGWPRGALTEILCCGQGAGALRLVLPALVTLSRIDSWVAWVSPPHIPYAPALSSHGVDLSRMLFIHPRREADRLWSVEQALRSGTCSAVLGWIDQAAPKSLRRLQLAAEAGGTAGMLFRDQACRNQRSTAALRLNASRQPDHILVEVIKCRGPGAGRQVRVPLDQPPPPFAAREENRPAGKFQVPG